MKFSVNSGDLISALSSIRNVIERRNTIPILANIKVQASKAGLTLTGTNLDQEMVVVIPAAVEVPGITTCGAHMLYEIAKKFDDDLTIKFALDADNFKLGVSCLRSKYNLPTLPMEDFPSFNMDKAQFHFDMPAQALVGMVRKVAACMSREETRYYLNGFMWRTRERMIAVATDGHRLAKYETDAPDGAPGMPDIIVPRPMALMLLSLLEKSDEQVHVCISSLKVSFDFGNVAIKSKLIDGNFPPYERVIPEGNDTIFQIVRADLSGAIDRVNVVSSSRMSPIKLDFSAQPGAGARLAITAVNPSAVSDAGEDIEDIDFTGKPFAIGFNAEYMKGILDGIESPSVRFLFRDEGSPAIVEPVDGTGIMYLLMPLRV